MPGLWGCLALCAFSTAAPAFADPSDSYQGPIIDAHAHIRLGDRDALSPSQAVGTEPIEAVDRAAGVSQSALLVIAPRGDMATTRRQNDQIVAIAAASGGRFYPVPSVHPLDGKDALAELDRLAQLHVREIKLHPNSQNFDVADPAVDELVEHAGELGLVLLFDSYKPWDASEIGKFLLLSYRHPKTKLVLAHMGFSQFRETFSFAQMRRINNGVRPNVWFDVSAIATAYAGSPLQPELVWTMRQIGMDRILFGSDWPVDTPKAAVEAVRRLGLTPGEQKLVFHDNAAALLGLP